MKTQTCFQLPLCVCVGFSSTWISGAMDTGSLRQRLVLSSQPLPPRHNFDSIEIMLFTDESCWSSSSDSNEIWLLFEPFFNVLPSVTNWRVFIWNCRIGIWQRLPTEHFVSLNWIDPAAQGARVHRKLLPYLTLLLCQRNRKGEKKLFEFSKVSNEPL